MQHGVQASAGHAEARKENASSSLSTGECNEAKLCPCHDEPGWQGQQQDKSRLLVMNPFTQHTKQQGVTYLEHWCFAMGIAWRLLNSVSAFTLHAVFPFIDIEKRLDLEATSAFLLEQNHWIENASKHIDAQSQQVDRTISASLPSNIT
jgi:hypothetical protein